MIVAGDIGGTSTRLAFFEVRQGRLHTLTEKVYPSREFKGLEEVAKTFVTSNQLKVAHACFGIAGPILNGKVKLPNLGWYVEADVLAKTLGLQSVSLINDLEANAYGIAALGPEDVVTLRAGAPESVGNGAVISAGTGLGEAGLYWNGQYHLPFACEGGHCDFAPCNSLEADLLLHLIRRFGRVSYERVLSGPGLLNIFEFLRDAKGAPVPSALADELKTAADPSVVISRAGLENRYETCAQALDLFVGFYGAEAGNLALKIMATGGVWIGGGIAPQILQKLQSPIFLEAFLEKGRMRPLMERVPVRVILNDKTALLGAGCCAARAAKLM